MASLPKIEGNDLPWFLHTAKDGSITETWFDVAAEDMSEEQQKDYETYREYIAAASDIKERLTKTIVKAPTLVKLTKDAAGRQPVISFRFGKITVAWFTPRKASAKANAIRLK